MIATLNVFGWTLMLLSCGGVTVLTYWCFKKVLAPQQD